MNLEPSARILMKHIALTGAWMPCDGLARLHKTVEALERKGWLEVERAAGSPVCAVFTDAGAKFYREYWKEEPV